MMVNPALEIPAQWCVFLGHSSPYLLYVVMGNYSQGCCVCGCVEVLYKVCAR